MKRLRPFLIGAGVVILIAALALAVAFSSWFQTWLVRRMIAGQPEMTISIGEVSAGLGGVAVRDVRIERDGAVLTVPSAQARLPLLTAALRDDVRVSQFVARGWRLDLTHWNEKASSVGAGVEDASGRSVPARDAPGPGSLALALLSPQPGPSEEKAGEFQGIFSRLELPVALALHGVDIAGEVILPSSAGKIGVAVTGGGLESGGEGRFELSGDAALADQGVSAIAVRATAIASMDSARTWSRVAAKLTTRATGTRFPEGVTLAAELSAAREAGNENYSAALAGEDGPLLAVEAAFPRDARRLAGSWHIDVRDVDLAPFMLGKPLPQFSAKGGGEFDADALFRVLHAKGRIDTMSSGLGVWDPSLAEVGALGIAAAFDVMRADTAIAIRSLAVDVAGERPVARLVALQPFEFNPATGGVLPTDPSGELLDIVLHGIPLGWLKPHLDGVTIAGEDLRGEFYAAPRAGGIAFHSRQPVTVSGMSAGREGWPWLSGVDLKADVSADYTPHGWQAVIGDLSIVREGEPLVSLQARAGRLAGVDQPVKATGRLVVDLPGMLAQPIGAQALVLTGGEAEIDFAANLAAGKEVQASLTLRNLATGAESAGQGFPEIAAEVRADLAADGRVVFKIPILIERGGRKSDLTLAGTLTPAKQVREIEGSVTSELLILDDARVLLAALPGEAAEPAGGGKPAPWEGVAGTVSLKLRKVVYSEAFQVHELAGLLRLEGGTLKLEGMRAGLGETGEARINGAISFDPQASEPYGMSADVALADFDPAPLLLALVPARPPTIEGRFNVTSRVSARGESLGALAFGAGGDIQVNSRGGVFRGLPVNVSGMVDNVGRLAGWLSSAGTALGNLTGRRDTTEIVSRAAAVAEFAKALNAISYDQLNVVLTRDVALNTTLRNFTLISPELRISGEGRMTRGPGASLLDDRLAMEFTLKARGRQADLLRYLDAIETQVDELGYAALTVPVRIGGTLGAPDASEFSAQVAALAIERSGLGTKASELLNRIRGGK